jgi:hypothetical protein
MPHSKMIQKYGVQLPSKRIDYHSRLWKLTSEFVRRKAQGKCFTCSSIRPWKEMDAGHFIDRSVCGADLYFDLVNVQCQCTSCNRHKSGNKDIFALHLEEKFGKGVIQQLFVQKQLVRKWTDETYKEKITEMKLNLQGVK